MHCSVPQPRPPHAHARHVRQRRAQRRDGSQRRRRVRRLRGARRRRSAARLPLCPRLSHRRRPRHARHLRLPPRGPGGDQPSAGRRRAEPGPSSQRRAHRHRRGAQSARWRRRLVDVLGCSDCDPCPRPRGHDRLCALAELAHLTQAVLRPVDE
eukprot:Amastigsp_a512093_36.p3 type:complete len:154 gc:universal Amastigsp_a512093_36:486-25(-)